MSNYWKKIFNSTNYMFYQIYSFNENYYKHFKVYWPWFYKYHIRIVRRYYVFFVEKDTEMHFLLHNVYYKWMPKTLIFFEGECFLYHEKSQYCINIYNDIVWCPCSVLDKCIVRNFIDDFPQFSLDFQFVGTTYVSIRMFILFLQVLAA